MKQGDVPDLSKEEKEKSKALADAWIKMDKAKECKTALKGSSVFLLGLPGQDLKGVGKMLAKRLEIYRFLDLTEVIAPVAQEPDLGHSSKELIAKIGEGDYREYETAILSQVQGMLRCVIATDSGVVLDNVNWGKLREGIVVYLQTDVEKLAGAQDAYSREELDAELERAGGKLLEADITMSVDPAAKLDETAMRVCEGILELIEKNPPKRASWQVEHDRRVKLQEEEEAEDASRKSKGFAPKPKAPKLDINTVVE